MAQALLSDEDFGLPPSPVRASPAAAAPDDSNAVPSSFNGMPVLSIGGKRRAPALLSDEDFGITPKAASGPLTNTGDESIGSGLLKGAATAGIKGLADTAGAVGNISDLADYLLARGESAARLIAPSSFGLDQKTPEQIMQELRQQRAKYDAAHGGAALDPANLPDAATLAAPILKKTGDYVPDSEVGKMAQAGLEGAIGSFGPGFGSPVAGTTAKQAIGSIAKMVPATAVGSAVGQGVTDVSGDPLLGMAAGAVAPAAAAIPLHAASSVARPFVEDIPGVGRPFKGTRERMAGEELLNAASDPAAVRKTLAVGDAVPDQASSDVVPGSRPTTAALTNDPGLLKKERDARFADQMPFNARAAEQNTAQRAQIERMAPQSANSMRPAQVFEKRLSDLDAATEKTVDDLTKRAQDEAARLGDKADPEHVGSVWRGAAEAAKGAAKAIRRKLYNAIDPGNKLNIVATPLRERGEELASSIDPLGDQIEGKSKEIFDKVRALPDVVKFNSLRSLEDSITAEMSRERRSAGETPVWGRLSQLKGAIVDVRNNAIENQAAHEQRLVDAGKMAVEDSLPHRIDRAWDDELAVDNRRRAGERPVQSDASAGRRLATEAPARGSREQSLLEHLAAQGGIEKSSETSAALAGENPFIPGVGPVQRQHGMSADDALRSATDAGYLHDPGEAQGQGERTLTPQDLFDLMGREASGDKQYRLGSNPDAWRNSTEGRRAESEVRATLKEFGIEPNKVSRRILDNTVGMIHSGEESDPTIAFERAIMQDSDRYEAESNARQQDTGSIEGYDVQDDAGRASTRGNASSSNEAAGRSAREGTRAAGADESFPGDRNRTSGEEGNAQPALTPNVDEAAGRRVAAAKASHAEYSRTFKEGPAAAALATNGFKDNYKLPNGAVPSRAFVKGDKGYETVKAFVKAAGNDPGAIDALTDYALNPLRDKLLPIGTVSPSAFSHWNADYEPALRALDEARPGFSDRFSTAAKATEQMLLAGAERKAALDEFQKSEAGKFLGNGKTTPVEVENHVGTILSAKDAPTRMRALVAEARFNPDVVAGLQKAAVDWMMRKFSTTAEAGTTGEKLLSGAGIIKFLKDQHDGLAELFPKDQLSNFAAVARDLERNNKWVTATGIKGSPGTAADLAAGMQKMTAAAKHHTSIIGAIVGGAVLGHEHSGLKGAAIGAATGGLGYLLGTLRSAGLDKKNALVADALLNPARARQYMSRVPDRPNEQGLYFSLARSIRRQMIMGTPLVKSSSGK